MSATAHAPQLFDEDHKAFRESIDTFLARRVTPGYADWTTVPRDLLRRAAQDGFLGIRIPESAGGAGVDDIRFGIVATEQAMLAGAPALALTLGAVNDVVVPALLRDGGQVERLPGLASGETLAAVVPAGAVTIDDDGQLQGQARFVVAGREANLLLIIGTREPWAAIVDADADGVQVAPADPGIGLGAAGLADITFTGARAQSLAEPEKALADLQLLLAVSAIAGAQAALTLVVDYVLDRKAFGQPIAQFQNSRQVLGEASANLQAGRAFLHASIAAALGGPLAPAHAAALKLHCTELYGAVVDTAVQLHGGYGYMMEYPVAHAYADARFWRLTGVDSQAARERVADELLG